jgi:seryl-tRNA synthetase
MLDIQFIRDHPDIVKEAAKNKQRNPKVVDEILRLDQERKKLILEVENLRSERNSLSKKLGTEKSKTLKNKATEIKKRLKDIEPQLRKIEEAFREVMLQVPNIPDKSVPIGKDETGNVEFSKWGTPRKFDFQPLDHIELAEKLDLIDLKRGAKVGGFRTYFLKNEGAILEFAVLFYAFRKLVDKGYTPIIAPNLLKEFTLFGIGQFPWGRDEVYHLERDDVYLAGTAEQPVTAYYSDEVLKEEDLPKKFVAFSPCFRREAGSYGKDTKGIYRLHQFNKIEQVVISMNDMQKSFELHEELLNNSQEILKDLELPHRVLLMCTGDMGEPQVKKYDIETWMPSRKAYGETMSNSVMGDFQARRLNIRYRTKKGKSLFVHTLNNTAIASPRILIPILENYQQKDGSVIVPKILRPYVGKDVIEPKV